MPPSSKYAATSRSESKPPHAKNRQRSQIHCLDRLPPTRQHQQRFDNRERAVAHISKTAKQLTAKANKVTILMPSQRTTTVNFANPEPSRMTPTWCW